jgi:hypothetical protein
MTIPAGTIMLSVTTGATPEDQLAPFSQFPDVIAVLFATAQPEISIVPAKEIAFKPIVFISLGFSAIIGRILDGLTKCLSIKANCIPETTQLIFKKLSRGIKKSVPVLKQKFRRWE